MKKILFLFLTTLAVLFVSCVKDDEVDDNSLSGTVWDYYQVDGTDEYGGTLKFRKSTFSYSGYEIINGVTDDFSNKGTYTYDYPNVVLAWKNKIETGTISGNKMIFGNGKNQMVYVKE